MTDDDIMKFRSGLREVMFFIKYSKDKKKLNETLEIHKKRFQSVSRRAVDVIEAVTNTGLKYDRKEEKVDMCQAIREMRMESERIGEERGALENARKTAQKLYNMGLDVKTVAEGVDYDVATVKEWLRMEK